MTFILRHSDIRIQAGNVWLDALLSSAPDVQGLIVYAAPYLTPLRASHAHRAAAVLRARGYATLLASMLTPYEESRDPDVQFDISLLSQRLQALVAWSDQQPELSGLPLGLLGTDTLAAAAIRYVLRDPVRVSALVSLAGRADLAGAEPLRRLATPTMMVLPADVSDLKERSTHAYSLLRCERSWREIEGASEGFVETGVLEEANASAADWFARYLPQRGSMATTAPLSDRELFGVR